MYNRSIQSQLTWFGFHHYFHGYINRDRIHWIRFTPDLWNDNATTIFYDNECIVTRTERFIFTRYRYIKSKYKKKKN